MSPCRIRGSVLQVISNAVHGDDPFSTFIKGPLHSQQSHRATTKHNYRISLIHVVLLHSPTGGRQDIGCEEDLLVGEFFRHLHRPYVGIWHPKVLGLATGIVAVVLRVTQEATGLTVGFGVIALGELSGFAESAVANRTRGRVLLLPVPLFYFGNVITALLHNAHSFVAHYISRGTCPSPCLGQGVSRSHRWRWR